MIYLDCENHRLPDLPGRTQGHGRRALRESDQSRRGRRAEDHAVDGELHADEEALLLENGSLQENLWGINIYPELEDPERIEFDSVINIRPSQGNLSRGVDDPVIRERIVQAVSGLLK